MADYELGGTDLAVSIDWKREGLRRPNEWFKTGEAALCTARWGAAFLCEFGHFWASPYGFYNGRNEYLEELFLSCSRSLRYLKILTFPVNGVRSRIPGYLDRDYQEGGVYGAEIGDDFYYCKINIGLQF